MTAYPMASRSLVVVVLAALVNLMISAPGAAQQASAVVLPHQKLVDTHEALIWVTGLNAEAGQVPQAEFNDAVTRFRTIAARTETGRLSEAEWTDLVARALAVQRDMDFRWVEDPVNQLRVGVPFGLVKPTSEPRGWGGSIWENADASVVLTTFKHHLRRQTINSYFRVLMASRPAAKIAHLELTSDHFVLEGDAVGDKGPYHFHARAYRVDDHVVGILIQYPPTAAERMEKVVNINASRFQRENGWKSVYLSSCGRPVPGQVRIIFGTNRTALPAATTASSDQDLDALYGPTASNQLHLGCLHIAVPTNLEPRRILARPPTVAAADPALHYAMKRYRPLTSSAPGNPGHRMNLIDDEFGQGNERALVFIHGYNVGFGDAVRRAAQIASDTGYRGKVYVFSWPSLGQRTRYTADLDTAEQSEAYLENVLRLVLTDGTVQTLDMIVHSMGSQPFLRVVRGVARSFDQPNRRGRRIRFGQVVFAAPDVGADVFREKVREIVPLAKRVTLYASSTDCAMYASRLLRLGRGRAGDLEDGKPVLVDGVQTIDASDSRVRGGVLDRVTSAINLDRLRSYFSCNHAYFADRQRLLDDLAQVLLSDAEPTARSPNFMAPVEGPGGKVLYWKLQPE